ncbi:MAG: choice-of-anchor Q domain-containing protein, partial [Candidatus Saccharimonadales bacterium]
NSLIQNNFSGIYNSECTNIGTLYVTNTTIRDSLEGPGIYNECGHVVLDRVTISGNYNYDNEGGGIRSIGKLDMTNVTIFGNGSDFSGGGIALLAGSESYDDSIFTNVTIANNEAPDNGGIYFQGFYSSVEMHNTLIANNSGDQCTRGLGDGVAISPFSTNNLATDDSCSETPDNNFAETADAKLATSLTDNGGEAPIGSGGLGGNVLTLALLEGSPAIGSGDNEFCPVTDERDGSRPFGTTCDIGAFEARFASANPTTPGSAAAAGTLANTGQNIALFAGLAVVIIGSGLAIGRVTLTKTY